MRKKNMNKSILMMMLLALLLMGASYAWLIDVTHTDITNLDFFAEENVVVTFWGYNEATGQYDIRLEEGDLRLTGLKPGDSNTTRIKLERFAPKDKGIYIKLLGVEIAGYNGKAPIVVTKAGIGYDISSFISIDVRTVDTDQSVTITGNPIPFDRTDHESILDILELVQGYEWPTNGNETETLYLDMTVSIAQSINVTGGSISINDYQKQSISAGRLNVQAVDI